MTKLEYNTALERFNKAMEWYHSKPPIDQQEKFLDKFIEILESLRVATLELKPTIEEMTDGFKED